MTSIKLSAAQKCILFIGIIILIMPNHVNAIDQEKINQLTDLMIMTCYLGQHFEINVKADGSLSIFKKGLGGAEGSFQLSKTEIPSIITFLESDVFKKQVSDDTRKCMMRYMDRIFDEILKGNSSQLKPSAESWHNCGAGKLPGDAILDARVLDIHGRTAYVSIDYSYDPRHESEKPIRVYAYLLSEDDKGTAAGYESFEPINNVGTGNLKVWVDRPTKTKDLFVFIAGTYYPTTGGPAHATPPYVCRRFPFSRIWE